MTAITTTNHSALKFHPADKSDELAHRYRALAAMREGLTFGTFRDPKVCASAKPQMAADIKLYWMIGCKAALESRGFKHYGGYQDQYHEQLVILLEAKSV